MKRSLIPTIGAIAIPLMLCSCETRDVEVVSVRHSMIDLNCRVSFVLRNKLNEPVNTKVHIAAYHASPHTGHAEVRDKVGELTLQQDLGPKQELQVEKEVPSIGGLRCDSVYVTAKSNRAL
jgi:hypothetical protein